MDRIAELWRRFGALSWLVKGAIVGGWALAAILAAVAVVGFTRDGGDQRSVWNETTPEYTEEPRPATPTSVVLSTVVEPSPTAKPPPTPEPLPDRKDCDEIRGTSYRSPAEREWFLANCVTPTAVRVAAPVEPADSAPPQSTAPPPPGPAAPPPPPLPHLEVITSVIRGPNVIGAYYIEGQVRNNSPEACQFVEIIASLYDSAGNFIGTSSGYADIDPLMPGAVSPFTILVFDIPGVANYSLQVQGDRLDDVLERC